MKGCDVLFWLFLLGLLLLFIPFVRAFGVFLIIISIIGWTAKKNTSSKVKKSSNQKTYDQTTSTTSLKTIDTPKEKPSTPEKTVRLSSPTSPKNEEEPKPITAPSPQIQEKTPASPISKLKNIVNTRKGYLLHVTELENLPHILKNGILSKKMIENENINPKMMTNTLSHSLDSKKDTLSYVHLAFDESYSMFSAKLFYNKLKNPVIIKISPDVLDLEGVMISNTNAAANDSKIGKPEEIMKYIDFEKLYLPNEEIYSLDHFKELRKTKQAEVLVKDRVPKKFFKEIVVPFGTLSKFKDVIDDIKIVEGNTKDILRPSFSRGEQEIA